MLLTPSEQLNADTDAFLRQYAVGDVEVVVLVGGTAAISDAVFAAILVPDDASVGSTAPIARPRRRRSPRSSA